MIRISKDRVLEDFFIDVNGVITNKEGEVQKFSYYGDERPHFKSTKVHRIQMYTKYGWRDGNKWVIHHKDEDKSNNAISNLVYLTRGEHIKLHNKNRPSPTKGKSPWNKGIKLSEEYRKKISEGQRGKKLTEEHKKKISKYSEKSRWYNDGVKSYFIPPEDALPHYQKGMLKRCKK